MGDTYITSMKERLERNEEEHRLIIAALKSAEALTHFDGAEQLNMNIAAPAPNGTIGKMSFAKGVLTTLQQAGGEPLKVAEIWCRMQKLGVKSNAKRPESFIIWHAKKQADEIEDLGNKTLRWIGN